MKAGDAVRGCHEAAEILFSGLNRQGFSDETARRPSHLPGWSVGHVLTHLARNANSYERMIRAASNGQLVQQYPGGAAQRQAEIDAGANRTAADLIHDLKASEGALADAFARLTPATWEASAWRWSSQPWPVSDVPFLRWREVALHTSDLGLERLTSDAWSSAYVEHELRRQLAALPGRLPGRVAVNITSSDAGWSVLVMGSAQTDPEPCSTVTGASSDILGWLVGRHAGQPSWPLLSSWRGIP